MQHSEKINKLEKSIQMLILASIFLYYFSENFVMSAGWDVLSLRSIDDFAMHDSVRRMQDFILAGEARRVASFFDYGYGNIFWLTTAIITLPLHLLDAVQAQIVLGRQLSLIFIFLSILIIGKTIQSIRPNANGIAGWAMISIAISPMIAIIGTKLHVNAPCIFFSTLSYYTLAHGRGPINKLARRSAIFLGVASGLKLTALLISPLLIATLLLKLQEQESPQKAKALLKFSATLMAITATCAAPAIALAPFMPAEASSVISTFKTYKNMGSDAGSHAMSPVLIFEALNYSLPPLTGAVILILFGHLAARDHQKGDHKTVALACAIVIIFAFLALTVHKPAIYIATYALSVSFFIPIGLAGIHDLRISPILKRLGPALIILSSPYLASDFKDGALKYHRFFEMEKSALISGKMQALQEMRQIVGNPSPPIRIYQDGTTAFPITRFTTGAEITFFYDDIHEYNKDKHGIFDYIVVNSGDYYFKLTPQSPDYPKSTPARKRRADMEEEARNRLRTSSLLGNIKYNLVYEGHQVLLYKRAQP